MSTAHDSNSPAPKPRRRISSVAATLLLASTLTSIAVLPASAESTSSLHASQTCDVVAPRADHRNLTGNTAAVERLYRALFLRSPTEAGLGYWTQLIQSGRTDLQSVAGHLADSEEFARRYGRLSDSDFVELLYCNVLGRHQQTSGSQYWRDRLNKRASRSDVTLYFSQSDEFVTQSRLLGNQLATPSTTATPRAAKTTRPGTDVTDSPIGTAPDRLAMVDEDPPLPTTNTTTTIRPMPPTGDTTIEPVDEKPVADEPGAQDPIVEEPKVNDPVDEKPIVQDPAVDKPTAPQLVWQDEFTTLDTTTWRPEHSTYGDGNNELQCYRPQNVSVQDGSLVLTAKKENYTCPNGSVRNATSGMVRGAVHFEYGQRIEFRVKVNPADEDDQRGLWPALWASSWNGGGWPTGGEFDWLEYVGTTPNRANHAIHFADSTGKHRHVSKAIDLNEKFSDTWHTIGFDWTDELVWYLDGEEVQRLDPKAIGAKGSPFGPNARPVTQIKLNFALGGNWPGPLGPTTLDAEGNTNFAIDYVRIYDL